MNILSYKNRSIVLKYFLSKSFQGRGRLQIPNLKTGRQSVRQPFDVFHDNIYIPGVDNPLIRFRWDISIELANSILSVESS